MARRPAVVTRLFEAASRWRAWFLVAALTLSVLLTTVIGLTGGAVKGVLFVLALALFVGPVAAAAAAVGYHPAVLLDRAGERVAVASPVLVLGATGYTVMITSTVTRDIPDALRGDLWTGDLISDVVWTVLLAALWFAALGPFGVRLRPEGVLDRGLFGSVLVPWTALASATPGRRNTVTLTFSDPRAVVRRGFRRKLHVLAPTTDAAHLAGAINAAVTARVARR